MNAVWTHLPALLEVSLAQTKEWEIQVRTGDAWEEWNGEWWASNHHYRGRPAQPKTRKVKMLCYVDHGGELRWQSEKACRDDWTRIPDEDKEIEVPE